MLLYRKWSNARRPWNETGERVALVQQLLERLLQRLQLAKKQKVARSSDCSSRGEHFQVDLYKTHVDRSCLPMLVFGFFFVVLWTQPFLVDKTPLWMRLMGISLPHNPPGPKFQGLPCRCWIGDESHNSPPDAFLDDFIELNVAPGIKNQPGLKDGKLDLLSRWFLEKWLKRYVYQRFKIIVLISQAWLLSKSWNRSCCILWWIWRLPSYDSQKQFLEKGEPTKPLLGRIWLRVL